MVIFIYKKIFMGGAETLVYRMIKWQIEHKEKVILVMESFDEESKKSIGLLLKIKELKIEIVSTINKFEIEKVIDKYYNTQKDIVLISFKFYELMNLQKTKYYNMKKIFYVINTIDKSEKYLKKMYGKYFESIIYKKFYKNNNIVFMDYVCKKDIEEYYGLNSRSNEEKVFPLPMYINTYDLESTKFRYKQGMFNILTIARADFPFKGYILGLIDNFVNLKNKYPHIILTIISYGKNVDEIKNQINKSSLNAKKNIYLFGPVEYTKLNEYFKTANIFVGMGTTLLDAANHGVPAIGVKPLVYETITEGFFHENPYNLGALENKNNIEDLIEKVILMNEAEYVDLSNKTYQSLKEIYDIEKIMPRLMDFTKKQKNIKLEPFLSIAVFIRKIRLYIKNRS